MELRQTLDTLGVDVDTTLHRFGGNEPLLARFVRRFPQDETYQTLKTVLAEPVWDLAQIERLAHTLKGLSSQLAVTCVYLPAAELCDLLRDGKAENLPQAQDVFLELLAGFEEAKMEIERY